MTNKTNTPPQPASAQGCCGSQASKDKPVLAVAAKPEAAPRPAVKRSAPPKADGSCCNDESRSADDNHMHDKPHADSAKPLA